MDTSNSHLSQTIVELVISVHQEDRDLAEEAIAAIEKTAASLVPLLSYLSHPIKWIEHCDDSSEHKRLRGWNLVSRDDTPVGQVQLFLDEKARFLALRHCEECKLWHAVRPYPNPVPFAHFSTEAIMQALTKGLNEAAIKRQTHLDSVNRAKDKLKRMLEILSA